MHGNPRRMASLPSWETISEPNESDDDDEGDENEVDEITSNYTRPSASTTPSGSQNIAPPSPAPATSQPRPALSPGPISPSRTQPAPSSIDLPYDPFDKSKDILKKLNTPGKRTNNDRSAMPPPNSSAVQSRGSNDRGPASSITQSSRLRFSNLIHHRFSESGTSPPTSFNASPSRSSTSTSAQSPQNRPVSNTSNITSNTSPYSPVRGGATTPTQSQASSSRLPPASQPPPRPQVKSFISAPPLSQPAKSSSVAGSNKRKNKEKVVIELDDSDETAKVSSRPMTLEAGVQKSVPTMPPSKKKLASSIYKKPYVQPSSAQKRLVTSRAAESGSDEDLPTLAELSQRYCISASVSSQKSPAASRSPSNRAERHDDGENDMPISSASQAPRKPIKLNGGRNELPGSARERVDKIKALNKSPSKLDLSLRPTSSHGSRQNNSGRSTVQTEGKSTTAPFPSTQPSSSRSIRVGQSRIPPLSQPANGVRSAARQTFSGSSGIGSRNGPTGAVKYLGIIDLSNSSDEEGKKEKNVIGGVIDLTLDDEASPPPVPARQPVTSAAKSHSSPLVSNIPATQAIRSVSSKIEPSSPPAIRPKPRISAIPKEKVASAKPQPPDSKPLDVSRRRSESGTLAQSRSVEVEGMDVDKDTTVLPRPEEPSADASAAEPITNVVTLVPAEATGQAPGSPGADFVANDVMNMHDFDGPADQTPATSDAAEDVAMQTVDDNSSASVNAVQGNREETSEPLERARELRSPSESAQMLEIQSRSQDANEGDLILEPSISRRPSVSQPEVETTPNEGQDIDQPMSVALSTGSAPLKKAETLTDKLDSLEISQSVAATDNQERPGGPEIQMADIAVESPKDIGTSVVAETEPSAFVQAGLVEPPSVLTNVAAPFSSPGIKPTTPVSASTLSPTMSAEQARLKRAASPGAAHAPPPKGNFMGMMPYVPKNTSPSRPSPKDVAVMPRIGPEDPSIRQSAGNDTGKVDGMEEDCQSSLDASNSVSESTVVPNADQHSVAERPDVPSSTDTKSTVPLSPRSRARQRIPDPPPPRKLNLPGQTPLSVLGIHPLVRGSRSNNPHTASNVPLATRDVANNDVGLVKELATAQNLESPAMVSARKLESILGGIRPNKNTTSSTIPSPITNVLRESTPGLKPESMPYVKKRMLEHTMQSPSSSSSVLSTVSPKQTKSANASPTRSSATEGKRIGKGVIAAPGTHVSSEEVDAGLQISNSGSESDAHETTQDEQPQAGTTVPSGRRRQFWFARKSTRELVPKKGNRPTNSSVERKKPSAPTRQSRKRSLSASAHSIVNDDLERPARPRRVASKRPRVVDSDDIGDDDPIEVRKKARKGSATSTSRSSRGASSSSADPIDVLNELSSEDSDTSLEPSTTSDAIVDRFANFKIEPMEGSEYPIVADRYFMNRDYGPEWYHVDDIPMELVNEVNDTPAWCRNPVLIRQIFEAAIIQNTTEDEPGAPAIRVVNNIDDEATPPFNFYYTNRMYHGHGVPPPEYKTLQGCKCIGLCDPTSKTCACVARQRKIFKDHDSKHRGFVYDSEGRVEDEVKEFPIFECNDACGCSDECSNRVVQNGRKCSVNIVKTKNKGWGVFAGKKIQKGAFIGIYSGEILMHEESLTRGAVYDKIGNTYLFDIDFHHLNENEDDDPKYVVDAYHVGNFTRFLNHSCEPNCRINAVHINDMILDKALLVVFAIKDINAGEELTFSYFGDIDDEVIREVRERAEDRPYQKCLCGSRKCIGILFTYATAPGAS